MRNDSQAANVNVTLHGHASLLGKPLPCPYGTSLNPNALHQTVLCLY